MNTPQTVSFPPRIINPAIAFTRFSMGALTITIVSGGHIQLPTKVMAPNAADGARDAFLSKYSLSLDELTMHMNHYVIDDGNQRILVDVGDGGRFRGATSGRLEQGLVAAGIADSSITDVVLTHGHADHVLALGDGGADLYPNAQFYIHEREHNFWFDDTLFAAADEARQDVILRIRNALLGIAARTTRVGADHQISPACTIVESHGHTPGHSSLLVASTDEKLLVTGDVFTHMLANFSHPDWTLTADEDGAMAIATRKIWLERAVREKIRLGTFHFPFPGLGRVHKFGEDYSFVPDIWAWPDPNNTY